MHSSSRGKGTFSNRGGRGRGDNRSNQRLMAANIASSSNTEDPLYKEFLAFKAQKEKGNTSYVNIVTEDNEDGLYEQNPYKEIILFLENKDLKWKDQPWTLITRYFDMGSYPVASYKQRFYYENILKVTESCEIHHYTTGNTQVYNFSKVIIKQIISAEDWGTSPLRDREMIHPELKTSIKFNYYDYIEAFNKAFLYENPKKKHSWFFKICPEVYKHDIPNWVYKWWLSYGPSVKILPEILKNYFNQWVEISPTIIELQHQKILIEGLSLCHFFIQFGIPWIWKWSPEFGYTNQQIPCLRRVFYTKFWKKMIKPNEDGIIEGQQTLDDIQNTIELYSRQIQSQNQRESPSPFQEISRKLKMQGENQMSKKEIISKYLEEVKKDLIKNLQPDYISEMSTSCDGEDDNVLPGESQDPNEYGSDEDIPDEEILEGTIIDNMFENLKKSVYKGKDKDADEDIH